jgi:hypothetical protein
MLFEWSSMRIRSVLEEFEVKLQPLPMDNSAASSARGKGEWKTYEGGSRQCKLSISNLNLPEGTELQLTVNGRIIGEMTVERDSARFRRETERGEFVPHVQADQMLQIVWDGKAILEGTFYAE